MNKIEKTCTRLAFNLFSPQKSDKSIIQQIENRLLGSHVNPVASRTGPKLLSRGAEKILVLCDSSVQQNTGSTNKSLTSQDMRPSQYYKKYKLSLDQKDIKKKKTKHTHTHTHKYNSVSTAYIQNLKAHRDLKVFSAIIWCSEFGTSL